MRKAILISAAAAFAPRFRGRSESALTAIEASGIRGMKNLNRAVVLASAFVRDEPQKVGLSWNILVALNTYFRKRGQPGLQQLPILETRGGLEVLVDSPRVVFMLGAKSKRADWDSPAVRRFFTRRNVRFTEVGPRWGRVCARRMSRDRARKSACVA